MKQCKPVTVKGANGEEMISDTMVQGVEWWCNGQSFSTDMRILKLGAYDAILGYDWLKAHSPMTCDWELKTMEFLHKGVQVKVQGVRQPQQNYLAEISCVQLEKWLKGNEVWAMAVVEAYQAQSLQGEAVKDTMIQQLLTEYQDVFSDPKTLPPTRAFDHTVPLVPGAIPVNSKPYRYSPLHKDEIEKQVAGLLDSGLIEESCNPFASPVLLV